MTSISTPVTPDRPFGDHDSDVILFDGVCNLCNGWVRFVINRDPAARFRFAPLQSSVGREMMSADGMSDGFETIILFQDGQIFTRSTAVLRILRRLRPPWHALVVFTIFPRVFRDFIYDAIAARRYSWFGRKSQCMIPSGEVMSRFLI